MKIIALVMALVLAGVTVMAWAGTYTTNYDLYKPASGETGWGTAVNQNFTIVDTELYSLYGGDINWSNVTLIDLPTGADITIGSNQMNSGDYLDGTMIADADYGDVSIASGVWTVEGGTGASTIDALGDAAADGTIALAGYKLTLTSTLNAAGANMTMTNTTADLTSDTSFIDFKYTDDGDANAYTMRGYDNVSDLKWSISGAGDFVVNTIAAGTSSVTLTGSTGVLTIASTAGGYEEGLSFDLDTVENTVSLGTATGVTTVDFNALGVDLGDAVVEITNAAAPTVDGAGEIAVDTTDDQLVYYGGAKRVLTYKHRVCRTIEDPTTSDDNVPIFSHDDATTITNIWCKTSGGTSAQFTLSDGTNDMDTVTCDSDGQSDDGSIANSGLTALEPMEFDIGTVTGTVDWLNYCFTYGVVAE